MLIARSRQQLFLSKAAVQTYHDGNLPCAAASLQLQIQAKSHLKLGTLSNILYLFHKRQHFKRLMGHKNRVKPDCCAAISQLPQGSTTLPFKPCACTQNLGVPPRLQKPGLCVWLIFSPEALSSIQKEQKPERQPWNP